MPRKFVLDNSVVMAWCFRDETSPYSEVVLSKMENLQALTPAIWPLELVNVLCVAQRKKRLIKAEAKRFITLVKSLPIRVEHHSPEEVFSSIFDIAVSQKLSSYDASYLELAVRESVPIATLDESLRRAARRCGVPVLKP